MLQVYSFSAFMLFLRWWMASVMKKWKTFFQHSPKVLPHAGSEIVRIDPLLFPGQMSYKATKPDLALSVIYLSMLYIVLLFIRAPFYVLLVFVAICSVFWLFWLSCQYLPSDWLERLLWRSLTVARGLSPENPGWRVLMIFLVYWIVLLCVCVGLFVLKVPLNTKQANTSKVLMGLASLVVISR